MKLPDRLPGELYNADDQCSRAYGDKSSVCPAPFLKEVSRNKNKKIKKCQNKKNAGETRLTVNIRERFKQRPPFELKG